MSTYCTYYNQDTKMARKLCKVDMNRPFNAVRCSPEDCRNFALYDPSEEVAWNERTNPNACAVLNDRTIFKVYVALIQCKHSENVSIELSDAQLMKLTGLDCPSVRNAIDSLAQPEEEGGGLVRIAKRGRTELHINRYFLPYIVFNCVSQDGLRHLTEEEMWDDWNSSDNVLRPDRSK